MRNGSEDGKPNVTTCRNIRTPTRFGMVEAKAIPDLTNGLNRCV